MEQNLVSLQMECFQSLNLAGNRVCHRDLVIWLLGWSDMLSPHMAITSSSGLSLHGIPEYSTAKVGMTRLGTSIKIVGVTWLLSTLLNVVAGCLMDDS